VVFPAPIKPTKMIFVTTLTPLRLLAAILSQSEAKVRQAPYAKQVWQL
jgi:hypothetical protein